MNRLFFLAPSWRMNVTPMKRIILTLGTLGLLTLASCSTTPGAHGVKNRIESQKRVAGHAARLELEQAYRSYTTGMFDQAMKYAEQARLRTPQDPSAYMLMARICLEQGRLESSDKLIGQALTLDPSIPDAHYLRGVVYQRWSRDEQALDAYMSAWNVDPNSVQSVHYLLAAGEVLVDMKRYQMARELLIPKLGYFENNAAMHHLLGTIAVLEKNGELAIEHLGQAERDRSSPTYPSRQNVQRARWTRASRMRGAPPRERRRPVPPGARSHTARPLSRKADWRDRHQCPQSRCAGRHTDERRRDPAAARRRCRPA